ncbi:hypothetical protein BU23DRAFT_559117 [Bimuria novae-zelandiae CBS 107.79]|uniref:RNase P subunit Pop3 n=1 Tax=Bimuria novae-zelandiae CBS 107.79 TaxID=1447943 RepID=A0A6A5US47_9PLEO|nr:hypothetical protein BU23DRAFT_559117 [Bimuria novae-zelandiae CBS 107.79]
MASSAKKSSKPVFKTARPYSHTHWPALTSVTRTNIMDSLCNLLQPLGDHRKTYIHPSAGKKRKRANKTSQKEAHELPDAPPPPPEIGNHILIGLNSVTRHLEALAAQTAPQDKEKQNPSDQGQDQSKTSNPRPVALVLIPHNHPTSSLPHAHIPTLVHLSTLNSSPETATRLLAFPPGCEPDIAAALHIPHVGALAVMEGAPGADALVAYVREQVGLTRCAWIDEAMRAEWKGVRVEGADG